MICATSWVTTADYHIERRTEPVRATIASMSSQARLFGIVGLTAISGCAADEAIKAGVNTAMQIGATAAYVATTGGCWGACSYGTHCDEMSAMCVPDTEEDQTHVSDASVDPQLRAPTIPFARGFTAPIGTCEVSGGACVDEGAVCTSAHDECVGQCRCIGLSWQCIESCD